VIGNGVGEGVDEIPPSFRPPLAEGYVTMVIETHTVQEMSLPSGALFVLWLMRILLAI